MNEFQIGIVTKPHGIRGEVPVFLTTDSPFSELGEVRLEKHGNTKIERTRPQKNMIIVKFSGIDDRNAAEGLVGQKIYTDKSFPLAPDEYYIRDLIGLLAVDESGQTIGTLVDVLQYPANDVLVIKPDGDSFMVPAIKEVVQNVSKDRIVLRLLPGLRELTV